MSTLSSPKMYRKNWVDYAKGMAIILVIIGHLRSFTGIDSIEVIIGTMHNSTFYFVAGYLFFLGNNQKSSLLMLIKKYILKLIYPFMIWTILYGVFTAMLFKQSVLPSLIDSMNKLWFLAVLFLGMVVSCLMDKLSISKTLLMVAMIVCAYISCWFSSALAKLFVFLAIVLLGGIVFLSSSRKRVFCGGVVLYCLMIFLFLVARIYAYEDTIFPSGLKLFFYLITLLFGSFFLTSVAFLIEDHPLKVLPFLGRNSLYYYVLHYVGIYYMESKQEYTIGNWAIGVLLCTALPTFFVLLLKGNRLFKLLFTISDIRK